MDLSLFRRLRPAEVCDAALPGEGRWTEALGRDLWGLALAGCSVGWGAAVDCGVCPPGRVHETEALGRDLWGLALVGNSVGRGAAWGPVRLAQWGHRRS